MFHNYLVKGFKKIFYLPESQTIDPVVARNFHRNVVVNSGDVITWLIGSSFVAYNTILPVYASTLTDSPLVIGLIPAFIEAGWYIPQLFMVSWLDRLPRLMPKIAWLTFVERLPFLGFALLAFWQDQLNASLAIFIFLLLLFMRAIGGGIMALPYQELIASVIPVTHRGRFFGISHFIGYAAGVLAAALAKIILDRVAYPRNFSALFFLGAIFIALSYIFLMLTIEAPRKVQVQSSAVKNGNLQRYKKLLMADVNYRWYLVNRFFTFMGNMAAGFLAVYAIQRFGLAEAQAAVFTAVLLASNTVGYAIWGVIGDRWGYKRLAELGSSFWLLAMLLAFFAPTIVFFYPVFMLYGLSNGATVMSDFNIAMEFGKETDRAAYIGLTRTLTGPVLLLAPLIGGALVSLVGYPFMFLIGLVIAAIGLYTLLRFVQEPRYLNGQVEDK